MIGKVWGSAEAVRGLVPRGLIRRDIACETIRAVFSPGVEYSIAEPFVTPPCGVIGTYDMARTLSYISASNAIRAH